jgi:hypothetical protein
MFNVNWRGCIYFFFIIIIFQFPLNKFNVKVKNTEKNSE